MKHFDKNIKSILVCIVLFVFSLKLNAQSDDKVKALWVFNFSDYVTWTDEAKMNKITIGVYNTLKDVYNELVELAKSRKIKEKTVEVIYFSKLKNITPTSILYVGNDENGEIQQVYEKIKGNSTLIITDRCPDPKYIMINILPLHEGKKRFEVNKQNALEENLIISPKLLFFGGTEVDLRSMYTQTEKQLQEQKAKLEQQKQEIIRQEAELQRQKQEIAQQKQENVRQKQEIKEQEQRIENQKSELAKLFKSLEEQQEKLRINIRILDKQEEKILLKQKEVELKDSEIKSKAKEIDEQDRKIKSQKSTLSQYTKTIETQQGILYVFFAFILLILAVAFLIFRGYKMKQKANKMLEEKNIAINKQKEELVTQAKQLELLNVELEKLSIVASKTHNAVVIMDPEGNFEWLNSGFTKMYGYTLQLLTHEKDENILKVSGHKDIQKIINQCVSKKETVIYESQNSTRNGEKKWVQTTLTPILDDEHNVIKLVAIDADISFLKMAEQEIRQKNEELFAQKEELEIQKNHIENQNKNIKSSITYALTIQKAILPSQSTINKYFDTFIIYKPKDIVSGDFYWFSVIKPENKSHNIRITKPIDDTFQSTNSLIKFDNPESTLYFIAVVDCTGHGVPGAFMSMIGSRVLGEIVNQKGIYSPAEVLAVLDKSIKDVLQQSESENNDGMDVCLCAIEKTADHVNLVYSGAKRPLYYFQKSTKKLDALKGERKSIGGIRATRNKLSFLNHEATLNYGDIVYLSTDGIIDQSSSDRKRFGSPRFIELLEKNAEKPLIKQKEIIEFALTEYQQDEEQRDDITVIGLKL